MTGPRRVIIESPYAGDLEGNPTYLRACMRDGLLRGEAPYASHALYTQPGVLDDGDERERMMGIECGFAWRECAELTVFYVDRGWSGGMRLGKDHCEKTGAPYEVRRLGHP